MSTGRTQSPAASAMEEAIELAIQERPPYPEKAAFVDSDEPFVGAEIRRAADAEPPTKVAPSCSSSPTAARARCSPKAQ
jgi:hypothetical protein